MIPKGRYTCWNRIRIAIVYWHVWIYKGTQIRTQKGALCMRPVVVAHVVISGCGYEGVLLVSD